MSDEGKPNRFAAKISQTEPENVKKLRIKVGSLRRTTKDLRFARKEVVRENDRLKMMRETESDKIGQQENVIREAEMMVPHSENRVRSAVSDMRDYLEKEKTNISNEELLAEVETAVQDAEVALEDH